MQGTVKWFDPKKGYGFIIAEDGKEIFAHFSGIKTDGFKKLKHGQIVSFDIFDGDTGPQAREIQIERDSDSED